MRGHQYPSHIPHKPFTSSLTSLSWFVCRFLFFLSVSRLHLQRPMRSRMWRVVWVVCEGYVRGYFNHSHWQTVWYQQVIAIRVRGRRFWQNSIFLRQKLFPLKAKSCCPTDKFLLPYREKFTGQLANFYCPTGEFLLPHEEIFTASPESFFRHVWKFLPPDLGKSFARPESLCYL